MRLPIAMRMRTRLSRPGRFDDAAAAVVTSNREVDIACLQRPRVTRRDDLAVRSKRDARGGVNITEVCDHFSADTERRIEDSRSVVTSKTKVDMSLDVDRIRIDVAHCYDLAIGLDKNVVSAIESGEEVGRCLAAGPE